MSVPDQNFVGAYGSLYPQNVAELRTGGEVTIYMHRLFQSPGEYIVPESETISISLAINGGFSAGLNLGQGYFRQIVPTNSFGVIAPRSGTTTFQIPCFLDALNISIPIARATSVAAGALDGIGSLGLSLAEDVTSVSLIQSLWHELAERGPRGALFVDRAVDLLVLRLLRLSGAPDEAWVGDKPQYIRDWRVRRSLELLEARIADDIGLAEIANEAGLSSTHFAAVFRAATGMPPHRWLMKRRVERACGLLHDPGRPITDIALACGFSSSQHFATAFRKYMDTTPSAYRRERLA